jgi:lipoic acid synthetase
VVLTAVARDDLEDGGASHFAATVAALRARLPEAKVEILTPDFKGDPDALDRALASRPDVFNHNIETVPRLFPTVRAQGSYSRSLGVLDRAALSGQVTKSGLMLGLGEEDAEVRAVLADLRAVEVSIVTLGQYLRPTREHAPVQRFVSPEAFRAWEETARSLGFKTVYAGVFVRSSYNASEVFHSGLSA